MIQIPLLDEKTKKNGEELLASQRLLAVLFYRFSTAFYSSLMAFLIRSAACSVFSASPKAVSRK